jgi:phage shock protein PspC (stress-responsive transcriptional regulator)
MNEVTRIHLGRQAFTISVDANHELKQYLSDIQKKVADKDVINEVELRMSELLLERGVTSDKVVIPDDVEYLKQQLGTPEDFDEAASDASEPAAITDQSNKRLFRDPDNALIAGVAAGLANYFGLDIVLMRIAFVLLTIFTGGSGIILYLVLWLVVPPAVTTSEKLQMQGRSVTLEALKDSVSRADVAGTAQRVNSRLLSFIDTLFRVVVKLLGVGFMAAGVVVIAAVAVVKMYMLLHGDKLFQENLFPVGLREHILVNIILAMSILGYRGSSGLTTARFHRRRRIGWRCGTAYPRALPGDPAHHAR